MILEVGRLWRESSAVLGGSAQAEENNVISSVVKEIREMREKTPALEHVPPIDLISALGVGAGEPGLALGDITLTHQFLILSC